MRKRGFKIGDAVRPRTVDVDMKVVEVSIFGRVRVVWSVDNTWRTSSFPAEVLELAR